MKKPGSHKKSFSGSAFIKPHAARWLFALLAILVILVLIKIFVIDTYTSEHSASTQINSTKGQDIQYNDVNGGYNLSYPGSGSMYTQRCGYDYLNSLCTARVFTFNNDAIIVEGPYNHVSLAMLVDNFLTSKQVLKSKNSEFNGHDTLEKFTKSVGENVTDYETALFIQDVKNRIPEDGQDKTYKSGILVVKINSQNPSLTDVSAEEAEQKLRNTFLSKLQFTLQ